MDRGDARDFGGPDCRAVVVGTGHHPADSRLASLPSASRSATAVARLLHTACGVAEDRITLITDPDGPTEVLAAVAAAVEAAAGGIVLFCFVGHGLLGPADQLYLATSGSTSADSSVHAVPYAEIRNLLGAAPVRPVVFLDCCFSGLARAARQGPRRDPYASARPDGSFLLASATHYAASFAPEGAQYTVFSEELLRLLEDGDSGGPKWFTLSDVYRHLDRRFQGAPTRPHADSTGRIGDLVLAANAQYVSPADGDGAESAAGPAADGPCPYPGMRPFLPEQRHLFFGREELTTALLERLTDPATTAPTVLVGPSGVGKSSLLRAGLVAAVDSGGLGPVLMVAAPGARPFQMLTAKWAEAVGRPFDEVERELGAGRFTAPAGLPNPPALLVIDQAEEIFTHCEDPEERELFIRALAGPAATDADSPAPVGGPRIVLGLRADYLGQCLRDPRISRLVREGQFTVSPMGDEELRSAIVRPAENAGLRLEDGLADHLLRELRQEHGGAGDAIALPFLAHALQETWVRRRGTRLTFAGYQATGGIRTSVARAAERIYTALDAAERRELRQLLLGMVQLVNDHGKAVRRRVRVAELAGGTDLLARLAAARLVIVDDGEAQLCHDSLLYGWPRLRDWIAADLDGLLVRRRLGEAADAWSAAGRPSSGLYAGKHLAASRMLAADDGPPLPLRPVEQDFLGASGRAERRKKNLFRTGTAIVLALAVIATSLAVLARRAQTDAEQRETRLIAQQLADQAESLRERDPQMALRLSLAAYRTARTPETRSSLYTSYLSLTPVDLPGSSQPILNLAFSPDSEVLATSQRGGRVQLWDVSRPAVPRKAHAMELGSSAVLAFHPRKRLLAVQSTDGFTVWDVADADEPRRLAHRTVPRATAYTLAFSPDGRTVATGDKRGSLRLWDLTAPARPRLRTQQQVVTGVEVISVGFNRDGTLLATGNGRHGRNGRLLPQVKVWDVREPDRPVVRGTGTSESVMAVAFHPKRDLLVATGGLGTMEWWSVNPGGRLRAIRPKGEPDLGWGSTSLPSLSFHRDGTELAAASDGGSALIRRVGPRESSLPAETERWDDLPAGEPVQAVAYSPDGRYLAAGEVHGTVRLWPERPPAPAVRGDLVSSLFTGASTSRDGKLLLTTENEGDDSYVTHVWDISRVERPRHGFTVPARWKDSHFLPGRRTPLLIGQSRAEGAPDLHFRLWEFGARGRPRASGEITVTSSSVETDESADGRLLAIGVLDEGRTELWDLTDAQRPRRRAVLSTPAGQGSGNVWFPADRTLATVEDEDDLRLWDVSDPDRPRKAGLIEDGALYNSSGIGFGAVPSAKLVITQEVAENLRLWNVRDARNPQRGARLPAAPGRYFSVGHDEVATVLKDGTTRFWNVRDFRHPELKRTLRLGSGTESLQMGPAGDLAITGATDGYQLWSVPSNGAWRTPSIATLDKDVETVEFLPHARSSIAVHRSFGTQSNRKWTSFISLDTDRIYRELCRDNPLSVSTSDWEALLPHLEHRKSCA
ncbi:caspase family protein [Streptomyces sp. HSW2009]|uniref:caspase, EACC1-associated type n=1 Tax=Streptomyces sp. HSW2009 TaxID=3142890 RepID=UPI0032EDDEBD